MRALREAQRGAEPQRYAAAGPKLADRLPRHLRVRRRRSCGVARGLAPTARRSWSRGPIARTGAAGGYARRRPRRQRSSSASSATSPASVNDEQAVARIAPARPEAVVRVRLRGADPRAAAVLAADPQRAPVAAAALARRRADRAGDHGRRRAAPASRSCASIAGLDSGPGVPGGRGADPRRGHLRNASRPALAALGGELLIRALDERPPFAAARRRRSSPTPRRSTPPTGCSIRCGPRPSSSASSARCTPHIGARVALHGRRARLACAARGCSPAARRRGSCHSRDQARCSVARDGALELLEVQPAGQTVDGRRGLPPRPAPALGPRLWRSHPPAPARSRWSHGCSSRARTRTGPCTPRRPGSSPATARLAMALAYGTVQRARTLDHIAAGALLDGRWSRCSPPVLAALRLGLYQIAADGRRRRARRRQRERRAREARQPRRRAARQRGAASRDARGARRSSAALDDLTPARAAILHSVPDWLAQMWWRRARRRAGARRCWRPSTRRRSPRCGSTRCVPPSRRCSSGSGSRYAGTRAPRGPRPAGAVRRPRLGAVGGGRDHAAVARLDARRRRPREPQPGERVLDLCAAPGAQDDASRRADARREPGRS